MRTFRWIAFFVCERIHASTVVGSSGKSRIPSPSVRSWRGAAHLYRSSGRARTNRGGCRTRPGSRRTPLNDVFERDQPAHFSGRVAHDRDMVVADYQFVKHRRRVFGFATKARPHHAAQRGVLRVDVQGDHDVLEIDIADYGVDVAAFHQRVARMVVQVRGDEPSVSDMSLVRNFICARFIMMSATFERDRLMLRITSLACSLLIRLLSAANRVSTLMSPSASAAEALFFPERACEELRYPQKGRHSDHEPLKRDPEYRRHQFVVPVAERLGQNFGPLDHHQGKEHRVEGDPFHAEQIAELRSGKGRAHGRGKRIDHKDGRDRLLDVVAEVLPYRSRELLPLGDLRDVGKGQAHEARSRRLQKNATVMVTTTVMMKRPRTLLLKKFWIKHEINKIINHENILN